MKKILVLSFAIIFNTSIKSQTKAELTVVLQDGNTMTGTSELKDLTLQSAYGNINIPLKKTRVINFGLKTDANTQSKIKNFLNDFKSSTETVRENAYEKLMEIGAPCIPIISEYLDANPNLVEPVDYSASKVFSELSSANSSLENMSENDIIDFDDNFKLGGNLNIQKIDLKTEFGMLNIPTTKIKLIEISVIETMNGEQNYRLNANKHISGNTPNGWLKTGIRVKVGQKLNITSNGNVVLASLSNGKYTPDGVKVEEAVDATDAVKETATDATYAATAAVETSYDSYPTYGQVVYKIGEDGEALKAGKRFNGSANKSGMLYLAIYETVYNAANSGSYNVKVKIK
jgi:hypothetical protein